MKIAQITPGLIQIPPNGWGAVEKIIWAYKIELEKLGHEVEIKYAAEVEKGDYDIIHVHVANLALDLAKRGIPYIFTMHDHHSEVFGKFSFCYQQNLEAIKSSVLSFVPSEHLLEYFGNPANLEYLPHGVDADFFKPTDFSGEHKLLCVGKNGYFNDPNFDRKGFGYALEAAKKLNLPLTVAGPKTNKEFFESISAEYDKLNLIFDLTEEQLKEQYKSHSIFLHPSCVEAGHPNLTLLEAMSSGLPIVGTYSGKEFELNGIFRIERDEDQIAEGIKQVISDYDTFRKNAINNANTLTWRYVAERLCSHYESPTGITPEAQVFADRHIEIYNKVQDSSGLDVDRIFILNLKNRTDRKERITHLLERENLGIPFEFIESTDVRNLTEKELEDFFSANGYSLYSEWKIEEPKEEHYLTGSLEEHQHWDTQAIRRGEIGCGLTHIGAWQKAHEENWNQVLFFEDDAFWQEGKLKEILSKIKECKADWSLAYLGRTAQSPDTEDEVDDFFVRPSFSYNAHAYLVKKDGIAKLANSAALQNIVVADEILPAFVSGHRRVDMNRVYPKVMEGIAPPHDQCYVTQKGIRDQRESDVSGVRHYSFSFVDQPKIEITTDQVSTENFDIDFKLGGVSVYKTNIPENCWASANLERRVPWEIDISNPVSKEVIISHRYDDRGKRVLVWFDSKSLGDNLAWMPQVERFKEISGAEVIVSTFWNDLFKKEYPDIEFIKPGEACANLYASYKIGCYDLDNRNLSGKPWNKIPLGETCSDILGIPYEERRAKVFVKDKKTLLPQKYVCISTSSTAGCKHWHGWQGLVDYLNSAGYKVVVIQKEPLDYMDLEGLDNVIFPESDDIQDAVTWLYNCEFFIGLSSGVSWLAHSVGKEVVMISGFTEPFNEFSCRRVINYNACHGCWHNHKFDKGDWNWCPEHKGTDRHFECMKTIKLNDIIEVIPID